MTDFARPQFETPQALAQALDEQGYVASSGLATVAYLALAMQRPVLLEGEPGVGKTELAKAMAMVTGRRLVKLQCYEGLDQATALYDWAYSRQLLAIRVAEAQAGQEGVGAALEQRLYSEDFLIKRPLLEALELDAQGQPAVLLIDEIDRADAAFEAFLLELLGDYQVSIPEFGVIKAVKPPLVILTSNRTRELHDALKRRCLYHWLDYPDAALERRIIQRRLPHIPTEITAQLVDFVQRLRDQALFKPPGLAESLDWAEALVQLDALALEPAQLEASLGVLLKYQDDIAMLQGDPLMQILQDAKRAVRATS